MGIYTTLPAVQSNFFEHFLSTSPFRKKSERNHGEYEREGKGGNKNTGRGEGRGVVGGWGRGGGRRKEEDEGRERKNKMEATKAIPATLSLLCNWFSLCPRNKWLHQTSTMS